ncbi:SMI1/KNR4 family protein [Commensalibacter communis]|uniref:SMI1/KNR4 family protein n=1 Tax=Commensalibacter communis TaxID=2972786 RepID=UPI0030EE30DE
MYSVNYDYQDRIPEDVMAIALVNEGDWLCLHIKGQIYYWDHDVNDLYLDIKKPNAYLLQNVDLPLIANSFQEFLEGIVHKERESDEGDCKNISTPISEALLKAYLKNTKIFSYNSYALKKLELSEKGKEVLALLKKEKLI